jgi:uncharacterized membrane protein
MRTTWRTEVGQLAIIGAMFLAAFATLPTAPDRVTVRWDLQGRPSGYADPAFALLMPPIVTLFIYLALRYLPLIDPGRANYATFASTYALVRWIFVLFMAGVYAVIHLALRGVAIEVGVVVPLALGILFVIFGNVMGKLRPNWFIGIRTPWTLSSKRSWTQTHAVGGRVFVLIGLAFALVPAGRLFGIAQLVLPGAVAVAMAGVLYLFVYSYRVWREDPERIPPAGTLPAD